MNKFKKIDLNKQQKRSAQLIYKEKEINQKQENKIVEIACHIGSEKDDLFRILKLTKIKDEEQNKTNMHMMNPLEELSEDKREDVIGQEEKENLER